MSLRLHDTATRSVRDFEPLTPGRVTMYLCGATVQGAPHLGHVRSAIIFDILTRWLQARAAARGDDLDVVLCRNVTDIDDKILRVAADEGVPWWRVASRNERLFSAAYDLLGCLPPSIEPRATGHVPQMVELMRRLLDGGHAYESEGSVYFAVRSFADYGALSGQDPAHMQQGESDAGGKRDPLDFALWKAAKPGEPTWPTPWGAGRPGWHLECSAMATNYLGDTFDIHGGGLDLLFPHHENERAQSSAAGDGFARYWMHNGLLTVDGEKMSKSLGNSLLVSELVRAARPVELRYYLAAAHYRSTLDFTGSSLSDAAAAYRRIEGFARRAAELVGADGEPSPSAIPAEFATAMDDDLGVPQAIAVVHTRVREGNAALADGDKPAVAAHLAAVRAMATVLGLDPLGQWPQEAGDAGMREVVDALVSVALEQRTAARARKDFAAADAIRDRLGEIGVAVDDTPAGPRWELKGRS